jgi:ribonuclease Y
MNNLEKIANEFQGIKKTYAFQAGREVWVFADSEKLSDYQTLEISRKIKEKIKREIIIPGEVTINVIREKVFIQKLNDRKKKKKI